VIVGAGAWGTAFALHLFRAGHAVTLVPRREGHARTMAATRENADYLPGIPVPPGIRIEPDPEKALVADAIVMLACPSHALRETCERLKASIARARARLIVSLTKGLELKTHLRPSQVIADVLPGVPVASLSGPTNAAEVAEGRPSAMVLGVAADVPGTREIQAALSGPTLRVYTTTDVAGVEYGGSLKNVYAIAAGCGDGLCLGDNSRAALLTRSLTEMVRVGTGLGARAETFYGLSGFGDLVATCHGDWSRNRQFGQQLGGGKTAAELLAHRKSVVEGYRTTAAFAELCEERKIDAPILREVHAILYRGKVPAAAVKALMARELKAEMDAAPAAR
jgi:glycerol-3-phosphate dehydrogenase (NAD(P)+)